LPYSRFTLAGSLAEALDRGDRRSGLIDAGDHADAMKLLEGLGPRERRLWMHLALFEAEATLKRPEVWAQVQALAARLLMDRTLTGIQAKRTCRKAQREFLAR
jgi:hypothetical protein